MRFLTLALTATLASTLQIYEAETDQQDQVQHTGEPGDQATASLDEQEVAELFSNDEEDVNAAIENCHDCDVTINITKYYDSEGQQVDENVDVDIADIESEDDEGASSSSEEESAEYVAAREEALYNAGLTAGTEAAQESLPMKREAGYNATYQESFEAAFYSIIHDSAPSVPSTDDFAQIQEELEEEDSYDRGFAEAFN